MLTYQFCYDLIKHNLHCFKYSDIPIFCHTVLSQDTYKEFNAETLFLRSYDTGQHHRKNLNVLNNEISRDNSNIFPETTGKREKPRNYLYKF